MNSSLPLEPPTVILAGGRGTRLAALTSRRPKTLLEIAGRTLLDRFLDAIRRAEVEHLIVAVPKDDQHIATTLEAYDGLPHTDIMEMASEDYIHDLETVLLANTASGAIVIEADNLMPPAALTAFLQEQSHQNWEKNKAPALTVSALPISILHQRAIKPNPKGLLANLTDPPWAKISRTLKAPTHILAGCFHWHPAGIRAFQHARDQGQSRMGAILDHLQHQQNRAVALTEFPAAHNLNTPTDVDIAERWAQEIQAPFDD